jgi:tryptophan halogenase
MQEHRQQNNRGADHGKPVRRVVIAGGGTAGWMVAAALGKTLGKLLDITLVESDEISTVGVGEATIPSLVRFHQLLELDEREVMAAAQATFKLGISFEHWCDIDEHYFHAFGMNGPDHWTAGFQHFWLKGRQRGLAHDYGEYSLELKSAEAGRFSHVPNAGMNYAYHLDASLYAKFLRKFSAPLGVKRVEGKIVDVRTDPASGDIRALRLDSGAQIKGDLFIDCSGFRALLIGQAMKVDFESWSHWLFCDRALALQTTAVAPPAPYTRAIAHGAGWQWRIALQHRVGNGLVYSSRHLGDEQARATLLSSVDGEPLTEPRLIRFQPGQRRATWKGNCVAFGLAGGFLEPIESTSIHLIQHSVVRLLQLFPSAGICQADIDEYNQQANAEIEHIRDFIILHYHVTKRQDSPFWQDCRNMDIPQSLRHRIALFRETGRVFRKPNELFAENSWIQVMMGQGILPKQYHPTADLMGDPELAQFLATRHGYVRRTVEQLPPHQAYVRRYCGVEP